ncbi:MAG: peptide chain release factor N(5)-glutamine methyltransferase [Prochlorococcaceae cyanobacterium]
MLAWRRSQLAGRDREPASLQSSLDWLLDLGGGVGWQQLQQLHLRPEQPVALQRSLAELATLWQRHLNEQVPLQYLLGLCPWRDLTLQVGPGVLIPRAETELLVELALQQCPTPPALWADLGSGSGALALALANAWPTSRGLAVELSDAARAIAALNLQAAPQVQLLAGSWWQPLAPWWGQLALVVANPPYIPEAVWADLEPVVRAHEPSMALAAGADGLDAIRQIAAGAAAALAPGGWLLLEHHHDQSAAVLELLAAAGLQQLERHRDLEGVWRFACGRAPL